MPYKLPNGEVPLIATSATGPAQLTVTYHYCWEPPKLWSVDEQLLWQGRDSVGSTSDWVTGHLGLALALAREAEESISSDGQSDATEEPSCDHYRLPEKADTGQAASDCRNDSREAKLTTE